MNVEYVFFWLGVPWNWTNYLQSLIFSSETRAQTLNFRVTIDLGLVSAWFLTDLHFTGQAFANLQIIFAFKSVGEVCAALIDGRIGKEKVCGSPVYPEGFGRMIPSATQ
jgi:hypothetical protein